MMMTCMAWIGCVKSFHKKHSWFPIRRVICQCVSAHIHATRQTHVSESHAHNSVCQNTSWNWSRRWCLIRSSKIEWLGHCNRIKSEFFQFFQTKFVVSIFSGYFEELEPMEMPESSYSMQINMSNIDRLICQIGLLLQDLRCCTSITVYYVAWMKMFRNYLHLVCVCGCVQAREWESVCDVMLLVVFGVELVDLIAVHWMSMLMLHAHTAHHCSVYDWQFAFDTHSYTASGWWWWEASASMCELELRSRWIWLN